MFTKVVAKLLSLKKYTFIHNYDGKNNQVRGCYIQNKKTVHIKSTNIIFVQNKDLTLNTGPSVHTTNKI